MKESNRKFYISLAGIIVLLVILGFFLNSTTGTFTLKNIDSDDLEKWEYSDGIISEAKEFSLSGSTETCWLLLHGYTSTPKDMDLISNAINSEFGEFVKVPRLPGHGTVPSDLVDLTINDLYLDAEEEFLDLKKECGRINLVGFSMGGTISLKLAQNYEVNNIYLISPYIKLRYKVINIIPKRTWINIIADTAIYKKKTIVGKVNDPQGEAEHIAYISLPLTFIKRSFPEIDSITSDLSKINNNILIIHSRNDETTDIKGSELVFNSVSSEDKELIVLEKSNHVIPRDFEKEEAINSIISFEKRTRDEI